MGRLAHMWWRNYWHSGPCENDQKPSALKRPGKQMSMKSNMRRRAPDRFPKILQALLAQANQERIPVEVVPLVTIPKPVIRNAMLPRPRRAKGVLKRDECTSACYDERVGLKSPSTNFGRRTSFASVCSRAFSKRLLIGCTGLARV